MLPYNRAIAILVEGLTVRFGEKLKHLRESMGWSQQELADTADVSVWAIRDYEQAKRRFDPGLQLLVKLAGALKVPMDVFADCIDMHADEPRPRGRPKKEPAPQQPKRPRGRPKKSQ